VSVDSILVLVVDKEGVESSEEGVSSGGSAVGIYIAAIRGERNKVEEK
jgi:hypothetical protein